MTQIANRRQIAVVGGGYAGMAAAVSLAEQNINVTVFESARILGGRARKISYRDQELDNGQHILSGAYSELLRLMEIVGVDSRACIRAPLTLNMPPAFLLQAPRWIAPFHLLGAMFTARGLTIREKLSAMRFVSHLRARQFRVDDNQTVEDLFVAHKQPEAVIKYLWQPLTVSALNTPVCTASAQIFANVVRDALIATRKASDLLLPRRDLSAVFPEPAADWIERHGGQVNLGVRVKSISGTSGCFQVETDISTTKFDAVIVAAGPHQLATIAMPSGTLTPFKFEYEPIVTVYLMFDSEVTLTKPMIGQADGIVQWFFDRRQMVDRAVSGSGLIAAVISASGSHQELSQDELAAVVLRELTIHAGALPKLVWHKVVVEKFATFACTPAAQEQRPDVVTRTPGIFLAGDYCAGDYPATLEGAVRNGIRAASKAADFLRHRDTK
ncbi:MAG: FAD-dependent oxidoreductase [Betaproteobacteria bacterium]|nr:FAD-dependent oxidoreductase [Betaproteobacteria bacterium]